MSFFERLFGTDKRAPRQDSNQPTGGPSNIDRVTDSFARSGAIRQSGLTSEVEQMRADAADRNRAKSDAEQEAA